MLPGAHEDVLVEPSATDNDLDEALVASGSGTCDVIVVGFVTS